MSEIKRKSHNVSVILYHVVCPVKYRQAVIETSVDTSIKEICISISERYEIEFIEIGTENDHVHFLIQSIPMYSPQKIVQMVKSITAREVFRRHPEVRKRLWGGEFWTKGYYINTVGVSGNEEVIRNYVKQQGKEKDYKMLYRQELFFEFDTP